MADYEEFIISVDGSKELRELREWINDSYVTRAFSMEQMNTTGKLFNDVYDRTMGYRFREYKSGRIMYVGYCGIEWYKAQGNTKILALDDYRTPILDLKDIYG